MAETAKHYNPPEEKMTDLLDRLALLTELRPRSGTPPSSSPSPAPGPQNCPPPRQKNSLLRFCSKLFKRKTQKDTEKSERKTKNFPKGIGYSVWKDDGWDVKAFVTDQRVKEREVVSVLQEILVELRTQYNNQHVSSAQIYSLLNGSALLPFLESKLERISFLDICNEGPDLTNL